ESQRTANRRTLAKTSATPLEKKHASAGNRGAGIAEDAHVELRADSESNIRTDTRQDKEPASPKSGRHAASLRSQLRSCCNGKSTPQQSTTASSADTAG